RRGVGAGRDHPRLDPWRHRHGPGWHRLEGDPGRPPGGPRFGTGGDRGRAPDRGPREPLRRLPGSTRRGRGQGSRSVLGPGPHPDDPALRPLRDGRGAGAGLMRCGEFRTTYVADEQIFETIYPKVAAACLGLGLIVLPGLLTSYWLDVVNRIGIAII